MICNAKLYLFSILILYYLFIILSHSLGLKGYKWMKGVMDKLIVYSINNFQQEYSVYDAIFF